MHIFDLLNHVRKMLGCQCPTRYCDKIVMVNLNQFTIEKFCTKALINLNIGTACNMTLRNAESFVLKGIYGVVLP